MKYHSQGMMLMVYAPVVCAEGGATFICETFVRRLDRDRFNTGDARPLDDAFVGERGLLDFTLSS